MNPLFKHDCNSCRFVKVGTDYFGETADVYVCYESVIFRLGNEPWNNRGIGLEDMIKYSSDSRVTQFIVNDEDVMKAYYEVNKHLK